MRWSWRCRESVPELSRERFPSCPGSGGSAEGLPPGQSPPREPGRAAAGDLTPAQSRPVTSFFVSVWVLGWIFFFLGAITLLPLKIAL